MAHDNKQYITENTVTALLIEAIIADIHAEQISMLCDGDTDSHLAKIRKLEAELALLNDCGYIEARKAA